MSENFIRTEIFSTFNPKEKILLINIDEKHKPIIASKIINFRSSKLLPLIKKLEPYLIIVTSQNSLSRTDNHFQHFFGEELIGEGNVYEYKRLAKIDATKPIHSSSIGSTFSKFFKKNDDPYNVKTRIYYRTDKVCLNFKDEDLNKKSCFTNKKNVWNEYNSTKKFQEKCRSHDSDVTITNYYMKRYSPQSELLSKTGTGIITIGLIFKIKDDDRFYKLIINNRCNIEANFSELIPSKPILSPIKSSFYIVSSNNIKDTNSNFEIKTLQLSTDLRTII